MKRIIAFIGAMLFLLLLCYDGHGQEQKGQTLQKWEMLSNAFQDALTYHEQSLFTLQDKLEALGVKNDELSVMLIAAQMDNDTLRILADQVGQRMQERDEELVNLYDELDSLHAKHLKLLGHYTRVLSALIGVVIIVALFIGWKLFRVVM